MRHEARAAGSTRPRLSEETIKAFRRILITNALAELCMERGYRATTISHVAARARMGRGTLYEVFGSKEEIFLTLLRRGSQEVTELVDRHCSDASAEGGDAIEIGLGAILHWVQGNVPMTWALLIEAPVGPEPALRIQVGLLSALSDRLRAAHPAGPELGEPVRDMLVGGVAATIRGALLGGNAERLPAMLDGLVMHLDYEYPA